LANANIKKGGQIIEGQNVGNFAHLLSFRIYVGS
jgi:hypothetical protein